MQKKRRRRRKKKIDQSSRWLISPFLSERSAWQKDVDSVQSENSVFSSWILFKKRKNKKRTQLERNEECITIETSSREIRFDSRLEDLFVERRISTAAVLPRHKNDQKSASASDVTMVDWLRLSVDREFRALSKRVWSNGDLNLRGIDDDQIEERMRDAHFGASLVTEESAESRIFSDEDEWEMEGGSWPLVISTGASL